MRRRSLPWRTCVPRFWPLFLSVSGALSGCGQASERVVPAVVVAGAFEVLRGLFPTGHSQPLAVLGDCNGDGLLEVLVDGNLFVQRPTHDFEVTRFERWSSATFVDLDGDGKMDLVLADNTVRYYRGNGDCSFAPPQELGPTCAMGRAVGLAVTDVDQDGLADVVVLCGGAGSPLQQFLARGDGRFEAVSVPATPWPQQDLTTSDNWASFGLLVADFDGDGVNDLLVMIDTGRSWLSWGVGGESPAYTPEGPLGRLLYQLNPMGAALLDFDRDGRLDLFLSGNGAGNALLRQVGPRSYDDVSVAARVHGTETSSTSWSPFALDVNFDGWPDLLVLRQGGYGPEDGTPARPYLYVNQRDGTFTDQAPGAIDVALFDQSMVCGDLAGDARIACLASDVTGTVVLRNAITAEGGWLGLRLRGTVSSPDAAGARVWLLGEGARPLLAVVGGQSPVWGNHPRDVLLAVGSRSSADVEVAWPSGLRQRVLGLPTGAYATVVEPRVLTVGPRVLPADGRSRVEVVVDVGAAGARGAVIERSGAGTWEGPALAGPSGTLRRTLVAPSTAGQARIEVRLDDVPLVVRPRVRFE